MKKVLVGLTALALLALVAGPALARGSVQVNVDNFAIVHNDVMAFSDTGENEIVDIAKYGGRSNGDNRIDTGDATAMAGAANVVNSNLASGCCGGRVQVNKNNGAIVWNDVVAVSYTGDNEIIDVAKYGGRSNGNNTINTGDATAMAGAANVVNSNLKSGECCGRKQINVDNFGMVHNDVEADAITGGNKIVDIAKCGGRNNGDNRITTGSAEAYAGAITVVNTNITRSY